MMGAADFHSRADAQVLSITEKTILFRVAGHENTFESPGSVGCVLCPVGMEKKDGNFGNRHGSQMGYIGE